MEHTRSSITTQKEMLEDDDDFDELEEQDSTDNPMLDPDAKAVDITPINPPTSQALDAQENLKQAYEAAAHQLAEKSQEADQYRNILEELGADAKNLRRMADEEEFLKAVRKSYETDPVDAFRMMVTRGQKELWDAVEERIDQAFREESEFKKRFEDFLNEPSNALLKPYEQEMEFLIRNKGLTPNESADLIRKIAEKRELAGRLRSAAAREIRNRSAVETGGEVGEPMDRDKEFLKIIKKAKTLDDMFSSLRKAPVW